MLSKVLREFFVLLCNFSITLILDQSQKKMNLYYDFSDLWLTKKLVFKTWIKFLKEHARIKTGMRMMDIRVCIYTFINIVCILDAYMAGSWGLLLIVLL